MVFGKSGATVGYGVDLGQHNLEDLNSWGASQDQIDQLKPYMFAANGSNLQGKAALDYVTAKPLRVPADEAKQLTIGAANQIYNAVVKQFNDQSASTNFEDLPRGAQTAILDLAYQYGPHLGSNRKTATFWGQAVNGQWLDASQTLATLGKPSYWSRRSDEARQLTNAMQSGELPTGTITVPTPRPKLQWCRKR